MQTNKNIIVIVQLIIIYQRQRKQ